MPEHMVDQAAVAAFRVDVYAPDERGRVRSEIVGSPDPAEWPDNLEAFVVSERARDYWRVEVTDVIAQVERRARKAALEEACKALCVGCYGHSKYEVQPVKDGCDWIHLRIGWSGAADDVDCIDCDAGSIHDMLAADAEEGETNATR